MYPRRAAAACLLVVLCVPTMVRAAEGDSDAARALLLGGKHGEAADLYRPMAEKGDPAAVLGLARCLHASGKRPEAEAQLRRAAGGHPALQAELAALAFERGDAREAQERADEAIRLDSNQLQARWILAELNRSAGRLDEAEAGYRWLVRFYNNNDVDQAEALRWVGLAAAQYARWNRLSDQFHFLVNELYPDAQTLDPDYWPAYYEAGMLFLEKYNQADAKRSFQAALELNPRAAEVHVAMARLAMSEREIEKAEASIERALDINPTLLSAWLTQADLAWANFDAKETLRILQERALPLNAIDEAALGRVAACYWLLDGPSTPGDGSRFSHLIDDLSARNAHPGEFYATLAAQLAERYKFAEAERRFKQAIQVMPQLIGPKSQLGLLKMHAGDEAEAAKLLDQAFDADPFNVRVSNTLKVLDLLDSMGTLRTDHFTIRYDEEQDAILARYAAKHLESVYPGLRRQFAYEPPGNSLFEIFNSARGAAGLHWLAARLTGLPYVGPVGASTGRMVAIASPHDAQLPQQLNWARVLTHELVHVFTLQQTDFNIPHWFTEGLAVYSEGFPRPQRWSELLCQRVPSGELFDLTDINFGFTRPNSEDDCQMAYCQAELYVEYMLGRWGAGRQRQFLSAYCDGLETDEAIARAYGVSREDFEKGYVAYLNEVVDAMPSLGYLPQETLDELLAAHRERPDDLDVAARLARAYALRRATKEAFELVESVQVTEPNHPVAGYVLALLKLQADRFDEATDVLDACLDEQSPQPEALTLLATLRLKAGDYDEAARLYALGERLDTPRLEWTKGLARVYLLSKNDEKLAGVLKRLAEADANDLTSRKKLARMALDRGDHGEAAEWARQALDIDVMDPELHRWFAQSLAAEQNHQMAIEEYGVAIELEPGDLDQRLALARVCLDAGQRAKARDVLGALLKLAPDHAQAAALNDRIEKGTQP